MSEKLFSEFPPVTTEEWKEVVTRDLKGADFEKRLVWKTWEGINVQPFYRSEDLKNLQWLLKNNPGEFPYVRSNNTVKNNWEVRTDIYESQIDLANKAALRNISRGCDGVQFISRARKGKLYGQAIRNQKDFDSLLQGIDLSKVAVHWDFESRGAKAIQYVISSEYAKNLCGSIVYDPIAELLIGGELVYSEATWQDEVLAVVKMQQLDAPNVVPITVQSHALHNTGANIVQEIAYALGAGIEYMALLTDAGYSAELSAQLINFSFSAGSNYFFEIARIRAFRLLWSSILEKYGVKDVKVNVHSKTSGWNTTIYDANVNMLRTTTAAMSAVLGGSDALTVVPYDAVFKVPDEFSYRIARNTQLILKGEAGFGNAVDPSAGSYYIETITDALAEKSLDLLKEWENAGGVMKVILDGTLQKAVHEVQAQKEKFITSRREAFLGTNIFPNTQEMMSENIKPQEAPEFHEAVSCCSASYLNAEPLNIRRGAQVFEDMRLKTESYAQKTSAAPKVFLWTAGHLGMRLARATFAKNFFGCAGFESVDTNGVKDAAEGLALAKEHKPLVFVLCSKDEEYLDLAQAVVPEIRKAYPQAKIVVAGNPENQEELKSAGVEDFVHVRTNAVDFLTDYQDKLGVK
ncbi:MAG: methylmalonyl-CoA mutase small subunit [Fibrobacter sp.]|nr:methylmalonyl-CoA mutase small subunit [Fibrobacter sp.]